MLTRPAVKPFRVHIKSNFGVSIHIPSFYGKIPAVQGVLWNVDQLFSVSISYFSDVRNLFLCMTISRQFPSYNDGLFSVPLIKSLDQISTFSVLWTYLKAHGLRVASPKPRKSECWPPLKDAKCVRYLQCFIPYCLLYHRSRPHYIIKRSKKHLKT